MTTAKDLRGIMSFGYKSSSRLEPRMHSHSYYEVYYFHEGKVNYLIGDKIYNLAPGDLILMYGMTLHSAKVDNAYPYIRSIVHFEPSLVQPFLDLPGALNVLQPFQEFKNHRICLRGEHKEEAERLLLRMHELQQRQDATGDCRMQLAFIDLLYFIHERCMQPMHRPRDYSSDKEKHVQAIISFIEQHYPEGITMELLEEKLHLTRSYLAKIFKEVTGVTIFEFIYQRRINQARVLFLLDTGLSVTEAGFQVGFKHLAHFSRLFKQQVGMTPETYRRRIREETTL
ncbi:AraC family transcriptional regulator [Paenibacillus sp. 1P07SE]|uniref:helix-turn-helix transcriptional regulator n=1 Tax=Paenibacillus sp. 1P07SE TaxID=3132209 RepID=UPI0039A5CC69